MLELQLTGDIADRETGPSVIEYEIPWDMKNGRGNDVASGVYLAYAHLYANNGKGELLAKARQKVVVIR